MSKVKLKTIFLLSLIGVLFAAAVTLRQQLAPATEPGVFSCVGLSIFGLSPCPYGLAFFMILTGLSGGMLYWHKSWLLGLKIVSVGGVLFSGWVVWRELCLPALQQGPTYWETFSLARVPACAWGFLVFAAIMVLTLSEKQLPKTASVT